MEKCHESIELRSTGIRPWISRIAVPWFSLLACRSIVQVVFGEKYLLICTGFAFAEIESLGWGVDIHDNSRP